MIALIFSMLAFADEIKPKVDDIFNLDVAGKYYAQIKYGEDWYLCGKGSAVCGENSAKAGDCKIGQSFGHHGFTFFLWFMQ